MHKRRRPFIPLDHKIHVTGSLEMVDEVVVGDDLEIGLNFRSAFMKIKPQILAATEDDKFEEMKKELCAKVDAEYVGLPKNLSYQQNVSALNIAIVVLTSTSWPRIQTAAASIIQAIDSTVLGSFREVDIP